MIITPILSIRQSLHYLKEFSIVTLTVSKSKFKVDLPASSRFDATQVTTGPELGSGAFGTVFRGDLRTDVGGGSVTTPVAIKTVKSALVTEEQQRDVMVECATHMKLNHPNVVQYFDSFIDDGTLHIVMQLCDRGDLASMLKRARA